MQIVQPDNAYSEENEARHRDAVRREFTRCHKRNEQFILVSPNGSPFVVSVTDAGALAVTPHQ